MEPGIANTSRPCSAASRAVMSEPEAGAASTTSVPRDKPAMMRLRCGKLGASGGVPERVFAHDQALRRDAPGQLEVAARIDAVQPRADDGDRGGPCTRWRLCCGALQGTLVRRRVYAQRQARDDAQARRVQRAGELARVFDALRRGVAAAHHGQAAALGERVALQHFGRPERIQQQRRVLGVEQRARICRVGQAQQRMRRPLCWPSVLCVQPGPGACAQVLEAFGQGVQRARLRRTHAALEHLHRLCEHRLRQAEGRKQLARRSAPHARRHAQAQPGGEFFALHADAGWLAMSGVLAVDTALLRIGQLVAHAHGRVDFDNERVGHALEGAKHHGQAIALAGQLHHGPVGVGLVHDARALAQDG